MTRCSVSDLTERTAITSAQFSVDAYGTRNPYTEEMSTVTSLVRKWRDHVRRVRDLRSLERAIDNATSPSMRNELLAASQRQNLYWYR